MKINNKTIKYISSVISFEGGLYYLKKEFFNFKNLLNQKQKDNLIKESLEKDVVLFNLFSVYFIHPFVYCIHGRDEIISEGHYLGYNFIVISRGSYPCAYIEIPKGHQYYRKQCKTIGINPPMSELTYSGKGILSKTLYPNKYYIGWAYNNCECYTPLLIGNRLTNRGHKYTTEDVVIDCLLVIDEIISKLYMKGGEYHG